MNDDEMMSLEVRKPDSEPQVEERPAEALRAQAAEMSEEMFESIYYSSTLLDVTGAPSKI
jgi:hypothetical protein